MACKKISKCPPLSKSTKSYCVSPQLSIPGGGAGKGTQGHDLTLPPARRAPHRQGTPARGGGRQGAGRPSGVHLWFTGHSQRGVYFPCSGLRFIPRFILYLPSEHSKERTSGLGLAGGAGLSQAEVITRPGRATPESFR